MPVAEGKPQAGNAARRADHRHGVRKAGAVPHPVIRGVLGVGVRENGPEVPAQERGPVRVGPAVQAAELHRARGAQSALHRRDEHLAVRGHHGAAHLHAGVGQVHVVAALRLERDAVAQQRQQPRGPSPGRDDDVVGGVGARPSLGAGDAAPGGRDLHDLVAQDLAAGAAQRLRDGQAVAARFGAVGVVGQEGADRVGRADRRLQRLDPRPVEHLDPRAVGPPQVPAGRVLRQLGGVAVQVEVAARHDQLRRADLARQGEVLLGGEPVQGVQRRRGAGHGGRPGGGHEARKPRRGAQPVARRHVQRRGRVQQHPRHLPQQAGHRQRHHGAGADGAGVAGTRPALPRRRPVHDRHRGAAQAQAPRQGEPDDARAHHQHARRRGRAGPAHRPLPPRPVGTGLSPGRCRRAAPHRSTWPPPLR